MQLNNAYIISWFGDPKNTDLIERRKKMHKDQVEWCWSHNLTPVIFAQNYADSDYLEGDIVYVKHQGKVIHPGPARNKLLELFYSSDNDYGLFLDNDTTLYEDVQHKDSGKIIEILRDMDVKEMVNLDVIGAINPARTPFSAEISDPLYQHSLVFTKTYRFNGACFLIKNLRKHGHADLYFDETNFVAADGSLITCEEYDFCIQALQRGLGCHITFGMILKEPGRNYSTWVNDDSERDLSEAYDVMNKKYDKELFNVKRPTKGKYGFIGYSTDKNGIEAIWTALDDEAQIAELEKKGHTDIEVYLLPDANTAEESLAQVREEDAFLDALIDDDIKVNKLGKSPVRFQWKNLTGCIVADKTVVSKPAHWRHK